ncbi:acyltransferase [Pseudoalteromonas sp. T1lg22]|uniref:acyltransferase n=1 Tax=Pseudoalteromonas sp. T1lg22 TaxID=2077096 RepID=UPI000CF66949|nr:acyltransferase [Pseudoalteromonas sp. T1lg22]
MKNKILKYFSLLLYYSFFKHLPSNSMCSFCVKMRCLILRYIFASVGYNVNVASGVRFGLGSKVHIGNNSGIGEDSYIVAMDEVVIGNDVMIAPQVMILTGGHEYQRPDLLLREQKITIAPVEIGNDCWIGARAVILPGVKICSRVVIASGAVVTKSIDSPGVYAGVPARQVREL